MMRRDEAILGVNEGSEGWRRWATVRSVGPLLVAWGRRGEGALKAWLACSRGTHSDKKDERRQTLTCPCASAVASSSVPGNGVRRGSCGAEPCQENDGRLYQYVKRPRQQSKSFFCVGDEKKYVAKPAR